MIRKLLLILATFEPQQQVEAGLQRVQGQLNRMENRLDRTEQQLNRVIEDQRDFQRATCTAEIQAVTGSGERRVPATDRAVVQFNLFSTVSKPTDACMPAEIRVSATYLDGNGNFICSGSIENVAAQNSPTQSINLEVRPWNLNEFVRWRNEPPQRNSGFKRLSCITADGLVEVGSEELARVSIARVRATVLPRAGGMSTAEIQVTMQR